MRPRAAGWKIPLRGTGVPRRARPNFSMRPEGADLTPSKRGASQPPILFSAAQPPRRYRTPRRKCGVRRREPLCGATGVYSIKRAPAALGAAGNKRERAAGAVQERTRQGDNRGISAEMQCGTASRAARDLPARPVPRKTAGAPGMERPESIPSGSPPRTARRGMEPCSPVNPFFLDGRFGLGEGASQKAWWGAGAHFSFRQAKELLGPGDFSLVPPGRRVPSSCGPRPRSPVPARGGNSPRRGRNLFPLVESLPFRVGTPLTGGLGRTIPPAADPARLCPFCKEKFKKSG